MDYLTEWPPPSTEKEREFIPKQEHTSNVLHSKVIERKRKVDEDVYEPLASVAISKWWKVQRRKESSPDCLKSDFTGPLSTLAAIKR